MEARPDMSAEDQRRQLADIRALSLVNATLSHGLGYPDPQHVERAIEAIESVEGRTPGFTGNPGPSLLAGRASRIPRKDVEVSDALPKLADAIVVGGGIVGAAVARQLAKDGVDTVLLEDRAFGGAVSGASLACLGTHMHNLDELAVLVEACGLWRDIAEELGNPFEYNRSGQLRFILHPEDVVVAQRWIDGERAFGLPPELLTPEEVREVEPLLTGPIHAASWSPGDATVNPFLAVRAFVADGRSAGVRALANTGVKALLTDGDKVTRRRDRRAAVSPPATPSSRRDRGARTCPKASG